jgi:hypothetical protein
MMCERLKGNRGELNGLPTLSLTASFAAQYLSLPEQVAHKHLSEFFFMEFEVSVLACLPTMT